MRKIILASASKPRQKLLRQIGLKFTIFRSGAKEAKSLGKRRCDELVIENAVKKAEDAAGHFNSGVVIAADTVVLVGKKIIGKPRNMKEAVSALGLLSKSPQWVYTGIAVFDIDKGKLFTDSEKTKVYMYPLSKRQIKRYFKKISPFDNAVFAHGP